ncbi:MAG: 3-oxoacyl-ACP synthase, partial [Acidimicrobiia bacterium]|nr:3-oxoacyl-ACP synthase [Acidimicrobiia bacterium]
SVLFGDGAGAVVVEATSEPAGVLSSEMGGDGALAHILTVSGTGTEGALKAGIPQLRMDGREVFRHAVRTMADSSRRVLAAAQLTPDEIDLMIAHQANERIIDATARRLGFDPSRLFVNIASCGNTSSASIPIALADALDQRRITPEANLLFSAFGGGLTWAACAFRWGARVEPLDVSEVRLPPNDLTALELLQPNIEHRG